jgi:formylglycine-generating enzyme required for sulfatase activity
MQEKTLRHVKVLIASPSDVAEERNIAAEVIREWNHNNSVTHGIEIKESLWELHSWPASGKRPQAILNDQLKIVDECDFAIAIFWSRIGTDTGVAQGGAVEEAELLMNSGREVMFYFSTRSFPYESDPDQQKAVKQFRQSLQKNALTEIYDDPANFRLKLASQLDRKMTDWYLKEGHTSLSIARPSNDYLLLQRYQETLKNHLSEVNLSGSPVIDSFSVQLADTFVSLRLSDTWRSDRRFEQGFANDGLDGARTRNPEEVMSLVFRNHRLLLVIGDPGSGKTTLLRYYALSCMDADRYKEFGFSEPVSVFFLPLRELKKASDDHESLPVALASWCVKRHLKGVSEQCFDEWFENSSTLVLLDGLDEISDVQERIAVCEWIDRSVKRYGKVRFVVTSRSTGYRKGDGIEIVTPHVRADIMDFTPEQQAQFLHKWFLAAYLRELPSVDRTEADWREIQEKRAKDKAETIVAYLNQDYNVSLRSLAGVPLMIQIMALLWKEREYLPNSRLKLYDAALDYLLDYRDKQKGIFPLLPTEDARRVLSPVSLWMQKLGKDEAGRVAMQEEMQKELDTLSKTVAASDFCGNLVSRAGLLVEYGNREYVFRHKTFREYLAGVQLVKNVHRTSGFLDDLVNHFGDDWWGEALRFFIAQLDDADLFDQFMQKLFDAPVTESLTPKQQALLLSLVREAPQKKIDALRNKLLDPRLSLNRRSILVDCLAAMGRADASEAIKGFVLNHLDDRTFLSSIEEDAHYIAIEGGTFRYSVTKKQETVADFYMARYPVTNRLYRRFIGYLRSGQLDGHKVFHVDKFMERLRVESENGFLKGFSERKSILATLFGKASDFATRFQSGFEDDKRFNGDEQPVVGITWYAARAYCLWLSLMENEGKEAGLYRLPNEIEWEYAAAGKEGRIYPWGSADPTPKLANYGHNEGATTPVGRYPDGATPEGLYDMAGNVWEWMENGREDYKGARALRGGSWFFNSDYLRCSSRFSYLPDYWYFFIGFRVVRPSPLLKP